MSRRDALRRAMHTIDEEASDPINHSITRIMRSSIVGTKHYKWRSSTKDTMALVSCLDYIPELTESTLINKFNQLLIEGEKTL